MKAMSRTVLMLSAAALLPLSVQAQNLRYDRGTILNMDWNTFQVEIKDAKDRERIWPVAKDATVKFSDKAWGNRGSTLKDLRRNMYVHFSYSGEPEVIQGFDVKDAGQAQQDAPVNRPAPGGPGVSGRVTAVDLNVAQVEVQPSGGAKKAYQAANAQVLAGLRPGDQVFLVIENRNGQEVVVQVRRGR